MNKKSFLFALCLLAVFSFSGLVLAADNQPKTNFFQSIINLFMGKEKANLSETIISKIVPCNGLGDINGDGKITIDDVNLGYKEIDNSDVKLSIIDVDGSGFAGFNDVVMINDYLEGRVSTFPACLVKVSCTDSDQGKIYNVKGSVKWGPINNEYKEISDVCLSEKVLSEQYCESPINADAFSGTESYECPNGCKDGACVVAPAKDYSKFSVTELVEDKLPDSITFWTAANCPTASSFPYVIPEGYKSLSCENGAVGSHGGCSFCAMSKIKLVKTVAVNGACGSAINQQWTSAPTINLCSSGTASAVKFEGSGSDLASNWTWRCFGSNGGLNFSCGASMPQTTECVKEGQSIPVTPIGLTQSCCSGLTLCSASVGVTGSRGTCKSSCNLVEPSINICTDSDGGKNYYEKGTGSGWNTDTESVNFYDTCYKDYWGNLTSECLGGNCYLAEKYCDGKYVKTELSINCPDGCKDGACISLKGATLSYGVSSSTPSDSNVMAGSKDNRFLDIKLTNISTVADINVSSIVIDRVGGSNKDLTSIKLFDGSTLLGTASVSSQDNREIIATFYPNIVITKATIKNLIVKADISSNATVGDKIAFKISSVGATYNSGLPATVTANGKTTGNSMTIISSLFDGCGSVLGTTVYYSAPTENLCKIGKAGIISSSDTMWSWVCHDSEGNTVGVCFVNKGVLVAYENEKYGYSIDYPSDYLIFEDIKGNLANAKSNEIFIAKNIELFLNTDATIFSVKVLDKYITDLEKYASENIINSENSYRVKAKGYITFNGEQAYQIKSDYAIDSPGNVVLVNHNSKTYLIKQRAFEIDMISSFKFTTNSVSIIPTPDKPLDQMNREELISFLVKLIQALIGKQSN